MSDPADDAATPAKSLTCPRCRPATPLAGGSCGGCGGRFRLPDEAAATLTALGITPIMARRLLAQPLGPSLWCPACRRHMPPVRLRTRQAYLCAGCGALWAEEPLGGLRADPLETPVSPSPAAVPVEPPPASETAPAPAREPPTDRAPRPAERPPRGSGVGTAALGLLALLVLAGAGTAWFVFGQDPPEPRTLATPPPPPGNVPNPAPLVPPSPRTAPEVLGAEVLLGGRDAAWWTERLRSLRASRDPDAPRLYALTRARAEAAGLRVDDASGVTLYATDALLEQLGGRGRRP